MIYALKLAFTMTAAAGRACTTSRGRSTTTASVPRSSTSSSTPASGSGRSSSSSSRSRCSCTGGPTGSRRPSASSSTSRARWRARRPSWSGCSCSTRRSARARSWCTTCSAPDLFVESIAPGQPAVHLRDDRVLDGRRRVDRRHVRRAEHDPARISRRPRGSTARARSTIALRLKLPLIRKWIAYMVILSFATGTQLFVEPQLVNQASLGLVPDTWSANQLAYQRPSATRTSMRPPPSRWTSWRSACSPRC